MFPTLATPASYRFVGGRAVVTDWTWLRKHSYRDLCRMVAFLNEMRAA